MTLDEHQQSIFDRYRDYALSIGNHKRFEDGACAMELAAHIAGEEWSDHPQCVCEVLAAASRAANDKGTQWVRDELRNRIPQLVGSRATRAIAIKRMESLAWFAIRVAAPIALRARGFHEHADKLEGFDGTLK